jgi:hypothetical protein
MTRLRAYRNIYVLRGVYVDSQCDYHFRYAVIYYQHGTVFKHWIRGEYSPGFGCVPPMPKYVEREIERQIVRWHEGEGLLFYEYDRDGCERDSEYRYYDPDEWARTVEWLREGMGAG